MKQQGSILLSHQKEYKCSMQKTRRQRAVNFIVKSDNFYGKAGKV